MNNMLWDTLYNVILLLFWSAIWSYSELGLFTNTFFAPIIRLQRNSIEFLKPIFSFKNEKLPATIALLALLAFRGIAVPSGAEWNLAFGLITLRTAGTPILINILFSVMSFIIFIFKIWCLAVIYARTKTSASFSDSTSMLYYLARPFSKIKETFQPGSLLIIGMLIAALMKTLTHTLPTSSLFTGIIQLFLISLSGIISILPVIGQLIFAAIIMSLISALTGSMQTNLISQEFINTLIGPMKNYPIRLGMFDLTPIIFMFALSLIYTFLWGMIIRALNGML